METNSIENPDQLYKVVKHFRVSLRKKILHKNLTKSEAQRLTKSYPSSSRFHIGFTKQLPILSDLKQTD